MGAENVVLVSGEPPLSVLEGSTMQEYDPDLVSASAASGSSVLGEDDLEAIQQMPGVTETAPIYELNPQYIQTPESERYRYYYGGFVPGKTVNLLAGQQLDYDSDEPQVIIPEFSLDALGFDEPSAAVGQQVITAFADSNRELHEVEATVVGVQERSLIGGNQPFVNRAYDSEVEQFTLAALPDDVPLWFQVITVVSSDLDATVAALEDADYAATTTRDVMGDYKSVINGILLAINILATIAIGAALFGIVNTLLTSIQERTRLLGLHRALGMSRRTVFVSVAFEAVALAVVGSVIAIGAGVALSLAIAPTLMQAAGLDLPGLDLFVFSPWGLMGILLLITVATALAAVIPAARAARLQPSDALAVEA